MFYDTNDLPTAEPVPGMFSDYAGDYYDPPCPYCEGGYVLSGNINSGYIGSPYDQCTHCGGSGFETHEQREARYQQNEAILAREDYQRRQFENAVEFLSALFDEDTGQI